jgi:hypothetical protein
MKILFIARHVRARITFGLARLIFNFLNIVSCKSSHLMTKALMKLVGYFFFTTNTFATWTQLFTNNNSDFVDKLYFLFFL